MLARMGCYAPSNWPWDVFPCSLVLSSKNGLSYNVTTFNVPAFLCHVFKRIGVSRRSFPPFTPRYMLFGSFGTNTFMVPPFFNNIVTNAFIYCNKSKTCMTNNLWCYILTKTSFIFHTNSAQIKLLAPFEHSSNSHNLWLSLVSHRPNSLAPISVRSHPTFLHLSHLTIHNPCPYTSIYCRFILVPNGAKQPQVVKP